MCLQGEKLYVGTGWGCLIVADAVTMRPISVFRPFSDEIQVNFFQKFLPTCFQAVFTHVGYSCHYPRGFELSFPSSSCQNFFSR